MRKLDVVTSLRNALGRRYAIPGITLSDSRQSDKVPSPWLSTALRRAVVSAFSPHSQRSGPRRAVLSIDRTTDLCDCRNVCVPASFGRTTTVAPIITLSIWLADKNAVALGGPDDVVMPLIAIQTEIRYISRKSKRKVAGVN